jgi:hypothetical protein
MADQNRNTSGDQNVDVPDHKIPAGDKGNDNSEWLRDQTGEDHNLSGSSTYRTLPDQPESDRESNQQSDGEGDKSRESNR